MAVNWNWNNKIGYYLMEENGKIFRVDLYCGNCLAVEIWHNPNNEDEYIFQGWWNDTKHLDNLMGLSKEYKNSTPYYTNIKEITLYSHYSKYEQIARRFIKRGIKTTILKEEK